MSSGAQSTGKRKHNMPPGSLVSFAAWFLGLSLKGETPRQPLVLELVMKILALSSVLLVFFFPLLAMSE